MISQSARSKPEGYAYPHKRPQPCHALSNFSDTEVNNGKRCNAQRVWYRLWVLGPNSNHKLGSYLSYKSFNFGFHPVLMWTQLFHFFFTEIWMYTHTHTQIWSCFMRTGATSLASCGNIQHLKLQRHHVFSSMFRWFYPAKFRLDTLTRRTIGQVKTKPNVVFQKFAYGKT